MSRTLTKIALVAAATAAATWTVGPSPAHAATSLMPITCDGSTLLIRTNNSNSNMHGGWSVAQIGVLGLPRLVAVA